MKFKLEEKSRNNTIWIDLLFEGGDADTSHYEEKKLDFLYSEWEANKEAIKTELGKYNVLKKLTGYRHGNIPKYDNIVEEYGEEIANMYEDVPNDPQGDFQWKTYLSGISLVGYDELGNKYRAYENI